MQINAQQQVFYCVTKPSIINIRDLVFMQLLMHVYFTGFLRRKNNMASKQVATTAGAMLSAAGKPKIFTDAKGKQFMVLK